MSRWLVVAIAVAACGRSDRARDCDALREVIQLRTASDIPRRYDDDSKPDDHPPIKRDMIMVDLSRLKAMTWRDAQVRAAVTAYVDEHGWTTYTPYSTASKPPAIDKLRSLCAD